MNAQPRPEILDSARFKPRREYKNNRTRLKTDTIQDRNRRWRLALASALGIDVDELWRQGREDDERRRQKREAKEKREEIECNPITTTESWSLTLPTAPSLGTIIPSPVESIR